MRMSCNGCRVLRKGCSDDCSIRPCLQWIKTPESQAHATLFLAKFYGRAGLLNLVNAGPNHLRPAIFRSLLYEACGRIVNPIYGSVGLLWSGNWTLCQNAVDAVLKGSPITPISPDHDASTSPHTTLPSSIKDGYNIRHVIKDPHNQSTSSSTPNVIDGSSSNNNKDAGPVHRVRNRTRFKKSGTKPAVRCAHDQVVDGAMIADAAAAVRGVVVEDEQVNVVGWVNRSMSPSRDSSVSHGTGETNESMVSVEMAEAAAPVGFPVTTAVVDREEEGGGGCEPELDLSLGLGFGFGSESGGFAAEPRKSSSSSSSLNGCVSGERQTAGFVTELGLS